MTAVSTAAVGQKFVADKVVAVVGNSPILYSEVAKQAAATAAQNREYNYTSPREPLSEALETLMLQKLLYNQALIDSISITQFSANISQEVENQLDDLVTKAGGSVKKLEEEQRKPLFNIKDDLRENIEEYLYAMQMRNSIEDKVTMTPGEVNRFFKGLAGDSLPIIPEQYVYAQITKYPKSTELARQRARERLLGLRERILAGERFDRLARMYSVDAAALRGGEMDPMRKEEWEPSFAEAVVKLKAGQVSGVVETVYGFHIIEMIDEPKNDLYHVRHIIIKPTFTDSELEQTLHTADSIATAIREGRVTFEEAALLASDDAHSKLNGGVVSNQQMMERYNGTTSPKQTTTKFYKDNIEPTDYRQLSALKPGEVSNAYIAYDLNLNIMAKIVKLLEIIPAHRANPAEDYLDIERIALMDKQERVFMDWVNAKIEGMYVRIDPSFEKENFENKKWFK
jgi:peptidyl-prolyl cis-trans isomerase SurA